jgi:hypothetical protein
LGRSSYSGLFLVKAEREEVRRWATAALASPAPNNWMEVQNMALTFPIEHQQETDWCWNACAVSVEHYFDPHSPLTQDTFAEKALGVPLGDANQPWYLQYALEKLNKLKANPPGFMSFAEIQRQLDANLPVGVHIDWGGGSFHYVMITGYEVTGGISKVLISDPILSDSNVSPWDYDEFVMAYSPKYAHAEGTWVDSCTVKP